MLESRDSLALSRLAGQLQERLQVVSMNFTVADETRVATENRLIEQPGFGAKTQEKLIEAIRYLRIAGRRKLINEAWIQAERPPSDFPAVATALTDA